MSTSALCIKMVPDIDIGSRDLSNLRRCLRLRYHPLGRTSFSSKGTKCADLRRLVGRGGGGGAFYFIFFFFWIKTVSVVAQSNLASFNVIDMNKKPYCVMHE